MNLTLDPGNKRIILDLDTDEWNMIQWVQSKGSSRLQILFSKLFTDRARTMKREKALDTARKLEKLPPAARAQVEALLNG